MEKLISCAFNIDTAIYNDPLAYADLILNGDVEAYLNAVTEYQTYEN